MTKKDGLDEQVTLRVASSDVSRIDNLAEQLPLKRSAVIRNRAPSGTSRHAVDSTVHVKSAVSLPVLASERQSCAPWKKASPSRTHPAGGIAVAHRRRQKNGSAARASAYQ